MRKFLHEVFLYFWIPLIMALVSYIFFTMHDPLLGVIALVALSAVYTIVRLYLVHKYWWLIGVLAAVVIAVAGLFLFLAPSKTLYINGQEVTGGSISLNGGSVSINPAPQSGGDYVRGAVVTLTAVPAFGYDWKSWSGTDSDAANPATVTMNGDKQVGVDFEPRYSLIINNQLVIGSYVSFNQGSVSVSPPPDADGKYSGGATVTLTAVASPGYDWTSWSGTNSDTGNPATVTMSGGNKNVSVVFQPRFSLTIGNQLVIGAVVVFPEGSVLLSPAPGDDGKYTYNTRVTLTAVPNQGYGWQSWAGTSNDTANPTSVVINSDKHITVAFEQRFSLTVNSQPVTAATVTVTGGSVSLNPAPGVDGLFAKNASVTLTAIPANGYRFDHWSGDASGTSTTVTINMAVNRSITAVFVKTFTLTVSISPAEGGSVSPSGGTFDIGTIVSLIATPGSGYRFDHWEGDASGTSATISVTMDANKSIIGVFTPLPAG